MDDNAIDSIEMNSNNLDSLPSFSNDSDDYLNEILGSDFDNNQN